MTKLIAHVSKHFPGSGAFFLMDSKGLPLEDIIDIAADKGYLISWGDFIETAKRNPNYRKEKSLNTLLERVRKACKLVYTREWWQKWAREDPEHYQILED